MTHFNAAGIAVRAVNNVEKYQAPEKRQPTQRDGEIIGLLFDRLKQIFPAWKVSYPTEREEAEARKTWLRALTENHVTTPEQIKRGLEKARLYDRPFMPSVGQFIKWCELDSEALGLPSSEEAFRQSVSDGKKHPAVIYALRKLADPYSYRMSKESDARKAWGRVWNETVKYVAAGGELPRPEKQIEQKVVAAPQDVALSHIEKMRSALRGVQ